MSRLIVFWTRMFFAESSCVVSSYTVHVFKTKSTCAAFLANNDTNSPATVTFQNAQYYLPPWSVSILPDCKNAIFNTAKITASSYQLKMTPVSGQSIRHHWPGCKASGNCGACSYVGTFTEKNIDLIADNPLGDGTTCHAHG